MVSSLNQSPTAIIVTADSCHPSLLLSACASAVKAKAFRALSVLALGASEAAAATRPVPNIAERAHGTAHWEQQQQQRVCCCSTCLQFFLPLPCIHNGTMCDPATGVGFFDWKRLYRAGFLYTFAPSLPILSSLWWAVNWTLNEGKTFGNARMQEYGWFKLKLKKQCIELMTVSME